MAASDKKKKKEADRSEADLLYVRIISIIYVHSPDSFAPLDVTFEELTGLDEMINRFNIITSSIPKIDHISCVCLENTGYVWLLPSQRDGQVEDREHHGAAVISEQVSDDGGRDGGVAGLSDTHQSPGEHKQPVVLQREEKKEKRRYRSFVIKLFLPKHNVNPTNKGLSLTNFSLEPTTV